MSGCKHTWTEWATNRLKVFSPVAEIYMCQCGALILFSEGKSKVLSSEDLTLLIHELYQRKVAQAIDMLNGAMKL